MVQIQYFQLLHQLVVEEVVAVEVMLVELHWRIRWFWWWRWN
jgi:hypothetical protein